MIVAIDGPAGSGKSTVARALSQRLNLVFLDTGAMYRSVSVICLEKGISLDDTEAIIKEAREIQITFGNSPEGQTVFANGHNVTQAIRTPEIDACVSRVAAIPEVREAMVVLQRRAGEAGDVVAEGRDIGTVVFPKAEVKVFLTADPEARAHRRAVQREGKDTATNASATADAAEEKKILEDIKARDEADSSRKVAPLKPAPDAHHIDSSHMTLNEVVDAVVALHPGLQERDRHAPRTSRHQSTHETKTSSSDDSESHRSSDQVRKGTREKKSGDKKLKAFRGNSCDDYFDTGLLNFPLPAKIFLRIAIFVLMVVTKLWFRWSIAGSSLLKDDKRPRVIIMNHPSMFDPVMMVAYLMWHRIPVRTIYKSEFDKNPLVKWLFSRVGAIPVERGKADMKAIRRSVAAIGRGECLLIFPEGTRIRDNHIRPEIHGGFALIAQLAGCDVQPTAIFGALDIKRAHSPIIRPVKIWGLAGERISFADLETTKRKDQAREMEELGMDRVYELRDQLMREHPGRN